MSFNRKEGKYTNDHLYYNIDITNNDYESGTFSTISEYNAILTDPLLSNPNQYELAIERFNINAEIIPLLVFKVQDNQPDADLGIYSLTIEYDGDIQQEYIRYIASYLDVPKAPAPVPSQQFGTYYFVTTIQQLVEMLNITLANAYLNLAAPPVGSEAPYFIYKEESETIHLVAEKAFYDKNLLKPIKIYFNQPLFRYLNGFELNLLSSSKPTIDGRDYQFDIYDNANNTLNNINAPASITQDDFYELKSEGSTRTWFSIKSIIFSSSLIPVLGETIADSNSRGNTNIVAGASRRILTDFKPEVRDVTYLYVPTGPYRKIDLIGDTAIYNIDLSIEWQDSYGNIYPLYIPPGETNSIKILFSRRDKNVNVNNLEE